jgi:hypothetical protein
MGGFRFWRKVDRRDGVAPADDPSVAMDDAGPLDCSGPRPRYDRRRQDFAGGFE